MPDLIQSFLQQATATGSKSTVLRDLRWFAGTLLAALLIGLKYNAPFWVLVFISVFIGLVSVIYLGAYIYFALKAPDSLRSERFTLSKMAIEKSITGDNLAGFVDPAINVRAVKPTQTTPKELS